MSFFPIGRYGGEIREGHLIRADQIRGGHITAQEIIIGGGTKGVIRSQNYDPINELGWAVFGDGSSFWFGDMTIGANAIIIGDIYSSNWDGVIPPDLVSGWDSGATQGFAFDSSVGKAQFVGGLLADSIASPGTLSVVSAGGDVSLEAPGGAIVITTDSSGSDGDVLIQRGGAGADEPQLLVPGGTASLPTYTFDGDPNTGIWSVGADKISFSVGGTETAQIRSGQFLFPAGTVSLPGIVWGDDLDTGIYMPAAGQVGFTAGGVQMANFYDAGSSDFKFDFGHGEYRFTIFANHGSGIELTAHYPGVAYRNLTTDALAYFLKVSGTQVMGLVNGGSSSSLSLRDGLTDVGNHETLRLDRGSGSTMQAVGYFSSWVRDPLTGRKAKSNIVPLAKSKKWNRDWFMQIRPIEFKRTSTKQHEFGFALDDFKAIDENMKYLTTKGDNWGYSPDEAALLAVTVDYVQYLERRVAALEAKLA